MKLFKIKEIDGFYYLKCFTIFGWRYYYCIDNNYEWIKTRFDKEIDAEIYLNFVKYTFTFKRKFFNDKEFIDDLVAGMRDRYIMIKRAKLEIKETINNALNEIG